MASVRCGGAKTQRLGEQDPAVGEMRDRWHTLVIYIR